MHRMLLFVLLSTQLAVLAGCRREAPPAAVTPAPTTEAATPAPVDFTQSYVVELAPGQTAADLRATADAVFDQVVTIEPLFPDVDPNDDPERLSSIHRLRVADPIADTTQWDLAYRLREQGGFAQVEPDTDNTLVEQQKRSAVTSCLGDTGVPTPVDTSWSLRKMNVGPARLLVPPVGGKQLGEGIRICHPDSGWTAHVDLDDARIDRSATINLVEGGNDAHDPLGYQGNPGHGTATGSVLVSDGQLGASTGTTTPGVVVGLAPKATLVPIRTFNNVVRIFDSNVARAVQHATRAQCDVISMSLGGRAFFGLERAINDAVRRDIIVVNAAGNCIGMVVAPASYDNAIAVAATNAIDKPWKGSSKGRAVDISAPGEDVYVAEATPGPGPGAQVKDGNGTSFATAAIAGAAADWIAFHGRDAIKAAQGSLTRRDLFLRAMQATARKPDGWDDQRYGAGILDLKRLLQHPLATPGNELRAPPRDDTIAILSRMFDLQPQVAREGVTRILGNPADLDAELRKYGPELLDLATRDPDNFQQALAPPPPGALTRNPAVQPLKSRASRSLSAVIGDGS